MQIAFRSLLLAARCSLSHGQQNSIGPPETKLFLRSSRPESRFYGPAAFSFYEAPRFRVNLQSGLIVGSEEGQADRPRVI